jgi:hypothetical protein
VPEKTCFQYGSNRIDSFLRLTHCHSNLIFQSLASRGYSATSAVLERIEQGNAVAGLLVSCVFDMRVYGQTEGHGCEHIAITCQRLRM